MFFKIFLTAVLFISLWITGCDPVPRHELSADEKEADMEWLISKFENNYGPKEYKEETLPKTRGTSFNWVETKAAFLKRARESKSNAEFFEIAFEFVSQVQDAHTSASLTPSNLPGRVWLNYLGFSGVRQGEGMLVTDILPTISTSTFPYPVRVGDIITHINGVPLRDYVEKNLKKFRNLGDDEANFTFHVNGIFNRSSIRNGQTPDELAVLKVIRQGQEYELPPMPWIKKDLFEFSLEQESVKKIKKGHLENLEIFDKGSKMGNFQISFLGTDGKPMHLDLPHLIRERGREHSKGLKFLEQFRFSGDPLRWTTRPVLPEKLSAFDELKKERNVPKDAVAVEEAKTFPAYIRSHDILDANGKPTGATKLTGYIRIDTFSPMGAEEDVIKEVKATLKEFQRRGIKDVVIDFLNNGGGSVSLVYKVAQAFSNKRLLTHSIRFGLNESWLDDFERGMYWGDSDPERHIQKRLFEELSSEKKADPRKTISKKEYPIEEIMPYQLAPNTELTYDFNIAVLTNEMCASAADIFADLMKQNALAILIGMKTMGAGGNVVNYFQSANAHFEVSMTESLIIGPDGTYIENNGVVPNILMDVSKDIGNKYANVIDFALNALRDPRSAALFLANQYLKKKGEQRTCGRALWSYSNGAAAVPKTPPKPAEPPKA